MFDFGHQSQSQQNQQQRIRKLNNRQSSIQQQHQQSLNNNNNNNQQADLIRSCRDLEISNGSFSILEFVRIFVALTFSLIRLFLRRIFYSDGSTVTQQQRQDNQQQQQQNLQQDSEQQTTNKQQQQQGTAVTGKLRLFSSLFSPIDSLRSLILYYYKIIESRFLTQDVFYYCYYKLCNFPMLDRMRKFWRWRPTSFEELDRSEKRILEQLKCQPKGYFVNIGKAWDLDNVQLWTIDIPPKTDANKMPIVLVHGFASGVGLWCLNLDHLAHQSNRRILAFDVLGFAKSSRPNFKFPKFSGLTALQRSKAEAEKMEEYMVDSIEKWRENVGLNEKFILLGHSFGGYLSLAYSLRYPKYVGHVILADPWGMPTDARSINNSTSHYHSSRQLPFWAKFMGKVFLDLLTPLAGLRAIGPWGPKVVGSLRPDLKQKFRRLTEPGADSVAHVDLNKLQDDDDSVDEEFADPDLERRRKEENIVIDYIYHCNAQSKPSGEIAFKKMCTSTGWARLPMLERIVELEQNINLSFIFGSRSWIDRQSGFQAKYLLASVQSKAAYEARRLEEEEDNEEDNERVNVHILQGAGHHVYADKPDEFNQLILDICADVDLSDETDAKEVEQRINERYAEPEPEINLSDILNFNQQSLGHNVNQPSSRRGSFRHSNVIIEEDSG